MFNRKSSYALNKKDPNAIVYMDANEAITRLTCEDFASEKEFLKWKSLSDEDYHASEKEAHVYATRMSSTRQNFSLRLMDFQAQAYPDARRKTRGACQLHRGGQSQSPVRPLCNRKRFS